MGARDGFQIYPTCGGGEGDISHDQLFMIDGRMAPWLIGRLVRALAAASGKHTDLYRPYVSSSGVPYRSGALPPWGEGILMGYCVCRAPPALVRGFSVNHV